MGRLLTTSFVTAALGVAFFSRAPAANAQPAGAQAPVPAEVIVILAKEQEGTIDPELADLPALRRPPFSAFRSMRILDRSRITLPTGSPVDVSLPNGRRLRITLEARMPDGRYRVKVSISRPNQNDYLPLLTVVASPGDPFFVAGQSHEGGTLVVGVRVGTRAAGVAS